MRRERVRLVNAHDIGATLYAAPAARLAGVRRLVHTDHSQILTKKKLLPVCRWIMKNWVSFSITVSHDLERFLTEAMRVPVSRVRTVPNAVDAARFASGADTTRLRRELGLGETDFVIGSIGRLMTQKGYEHLLRAFPEIAREKPGARLLLVGDGELRGELEALARTLGIEKAVLFTGIRRDVPELLRLFDVFALASLWEGQPITLMEAMAAGKAIVVTDVGDNARILGAGSRGVVVKPGDPGALAGAVVGFARDPALAAALGARAQEYAANAFNVQSMVKRYEEVFSAVMADDTRRLKA
jgi:glycosyltransferase involved in cell wall biosynthesis